ncbi:MAG: polysaccharide biosynthesis protein [Synergistaceae bacterium]|nr:polysaccharide biosynthesis protein [Synergistaceae bacterium]
MLPFFRRRSGAIKLLMDTALGFFGAWAAFALRLGLPLPYLYAGSLLPYIMISGLLKVALNWYFSLFRQSWQNVGMSDLVRIGQCAILFTVMTSGASFLLGRPYFPLPRSIPLIDGLVTVFLWGGARALSRLFQEGGKARPEARRVLIAGAGDAGVLIAREMLRHPEAGLEPVGFLDDDPAKRTVTFLGLPVLGPLHALQGVVQDHSVDEVLIAIPSARGEVVRSVLDMARRAGAPARIVPAMLEVLSGKVSISHIREVRVEDLLNREPVVLRLEEIAEFVEGRTVLVTGAGGSIGSEIVRQLLPFSPGRLVLLGRGENSLFQLEQELTVSGVGTPFDTVVADVRNRERLMRAFERFRPQVVFHAAAHKHVPLMESNPEEAVLNNVFGTANLVAASLDSGTEVFVNISTDKAVNPTSVMGASKRVAEMIVRDAAGLATDGRAFVSVRFGNVLGSRGSVIPTFKEQIRRGGPLTVTDPGMTRFFMTIPEAAQLVLQAGGMRRNGAVFVLDMGEPVRIEDLAADLIRLSGLEPGKDVEIVYSGIRPGEKLFEELLTAEEGTDASRFSKIFIARDNDLPPGFDDLLDELRSAAEAEDEPAIRTALQRIIPHAKLNAPGG